MLKSLQEAILNQAAAIAEYQQLYLLGRYQREPDHEIELAPARMKMATAELQVRLLAAQLGDDELWQMINTPLSDEERITEYEKMTKETGNIRQQSDQWNARIRELYKKF